MEEVFHGTISMRRAQPRNKNCCLAAWRSSEPAPDALPLRLAKLVLPRARLADRANVAERGVLGESAIAIQAGPGKEDRLLRGLYIALREQEALERKEAAPKSGSYLPDFLD
jgi:hypothetical protein